MLFLLACGEPTDTSTVETAGDTEDSGGVPSGWPDPMPSCDGLASPYPLSSADDLDAAWATMPTLEVAATMMSHVEEVSDTMGCPSLLADPCGAGTIYTGGCSVGAVSAEGTATGTGCDDGGAWIWEAFSVTTPEWSLTVDGTADFQMSGSLVETWDDVHATLSGFDPEGTFVWEGEHREGSPAETRSLRVSVDGIGDYCVDEERPPVDGCAEESTGWTVVQGESAAVVLWDGDVACDGCGALYIDGVDVGAWCPGQS